MGHGINGNRHSKVCVLRSSLLVEFAFQHSNILHEVTVVELHATVEDCSLTLHELICMSILSCSICVCEAVKEIRTDVKLKKNKIILAAQLPFCDVTILHYLLPDMAV